MRSRGSVVLKRISNTPSVSILPGERVFHKLSDGTYEPATITLEAVVQNVDNPKYQWGRIVGGSFRPYSVVYSHMIASPVHAGVVAVKVTGDNVPNAIIASEVLTIVEDGVSPVQYKIVVSQLNRVVDSISCDAYGNPKIYYQATAYLYKITGNTEVLCEDFYCVVVYYKNGTQSDASVSTSPSGSYTFDVSGDYDLIHVGFIDSPSGKVIIDTSLAKVYDGAPAVQYSIDILQNGKPVNTIASDAEGYPKLEPTAFARLYKKVGNGERTICSDFYCKVVSMNTDDNVSNEEESGVPVSDYEFEVADNYYDSFAVSFFDKASKKTVAEISISRTFDGSTGESGYTYRSRGMFTTGETYVWNSEYRDIVFSWFNNKLYAFRVKNKGASVTVPPTSSNGDDNWDDASELEFVATDLLLAQDAVVNVIGTSKIFIGELDKTEGWEITKGAIRHSATGLELTKDGKLLSPKDGIKIGTQSVEEMLDGIQVGSRNYAHGTSGEWGKSVALQNALNQVIDLHPCYLADLKVGDAVYVSFDIEFKNITKGPGAIVTIQAPGNVTGWDDGGITMGDITQRLSAGNGEAHITLFNTVTAAHLNNTIWPMNARFDYMSGSVRFKNFKFGIGNKSTDWSPAPEDFVETGIDISNRKITLKADTTVFKNNAGEDIAIFDEHGIVAKKVETSIDGKRIIISPDTSSLLMVDSLGNKALEIRFPTWASGSTSAFGSYITIKSHRTAMQVGESLPWDSTIVISDEEISMEGTYNEYGVSGTVKRKVSINPYGISFYKNGSLKKTYNNE